MANIPEQVSELIASKYNRHENTLARFVKSERRDLIDIEIGDSKQPDFKPQFKFKRWNNEVNFSIRAEEHPSATVETDGEVIKYKTPDYEVHMYDKPEVAEDGGFEFEWILKKKPKSNVLSTTIQTKDLNFYYQPPLTQEEIDEGASRPENVVGSYAVYHKTKGGMNRANGMEYKTGKAFHIYRPKVTDANGTEIWGELNIDEKTNKLTVTVDQTYLDNAVYPVVVDPTFGYTSAGGGTQVIARNDFGLKNEYRVGNSYTISESATLSKLTVYMLREGAGTTSNAKGFINQKDSAASGSHDQIDSGGITSFDATSASWFDITLSGSSLTNGTEYVLNVIGDEDGLPGSLSEYLYTFYDSVSSTYYNETKSQYDTPEDPWTEASSTGSFKFSIYATYTVDCDAIFTYYMPITIDNTKVSGSSNFTDFTAFVKFTSDNLKTTANGGHVESTSGYDICFADTSGNSLSFEIESWNGSTGAIEVWVKIPTLSYNSDTTIRVYYGSSTTSGSLEDIPGTWDSNYKAVWHLNNSLKDSAYGRHTLSDNGGSTNTTGHIGDGRSFDGTDDYLSTTGEGDLDLLSGFTIEGIVNINASKNTENGIVSKVSYNYIVKSTSVVRLEIQRASDGGFTSFDTSGTITDTTWTYLAATYDGTNMRMYINGAEDANSPNALSDSVFNRADSVFVGRHSSGYWPGKLDEVRLHDTTRSADWIATMDNFMMDQNHLTVGSEVGGAVETATGSAIGLMGVGEGN